MKKKEKLPQVNESLKKVLILKGNNSSQNVNDVLKDLALMIKPNCKVLTRKNEIFPFEDINSLEFLCQKNDCSLFIFGSHSKKRPNNIIIVRFYIIYIIYTILLTIHFARFYYHFIHKLGENV